MIVILVTFWATWCQNSDNFFLGHTVVMGHYVHDLEAKSHRSTVSHEAKSWENLRPEYWPRRWTYSITGVVGILSVIFFPGLSTLKQLQVTVLRKANYCLLVVHLLLNLFQKFIFIPIGNSVKPQWMVTEKPKWVIWLIWAIVGQYTDKMTQKYVKNESFCPCSDPLWLKWVKWLIWVFLSWICRELCQGNFPSCEAIHSFWLDIDRKLHELK